MSAQTTKPLIISLVFAGVALERKMMDMTQMIIFKPSITR